MLTNTHTHTKEYQNTSEMQKITWEMANYTQINNNKVQYAVKYNNTWNI